MGNKIHILSLPAHSSDKLQPLDVGVFGPAKKVWLSVKRDFGRKTNFKSISKEDFPPLMKELRTRDGFKKKNIISGFRSSGIWPLNIEEALKKLPPIQQRPISTSNVPTAETQERPVDVYKRQPVN